MLARAGGKFYREEPRNFPVPQGKNDFSINHLTVPYFGVPFAYISYTERFICEPFLAMQYKRDIIKLYWICRCFPCDKFVKNVFRPM